MARQQPHGRAHDAAIDGQVDGIARSKPEDLRGFRSDQGGIAPDLLRERFRELLQPAVIGIGAVPDGWIGREEDIDPCG
jgi:hypothetical protein